MLLLSTGIKDECYRLAVSGRSHQGYAVEDFDDEAAYGCRSASRWSLGGSNPCG